MQKEMKMPIVKMKMELIWSKLPMKEIFITIKIFSCKMIIQMWKMMILMEKADSKSKIKKLITIKIMQIKMQYMETLKIIIWRILEMMMMRVRMMRIMMITEMTMMLLMIIIKIKDMQSCRTIKQSLMILN